MTKVRDYIESIIREPKLAHDAGKAFRNTTLILTMKSREPEIYINWRSVTELLEDGIVFSEQKGQYAKLDILVIPYDSISYVKYALEEEYDPKAPKVDNPEDF